MAWVSPAALKMALAWAEDSFKRQYRTEVSSVAQDVFSTIDTLRQQPEWSLLSFVNKKNKNT